jgi:hypothetical protein
MKTKDGRFRTIFVHKFTERDPLKQVSIIGSLIVLFNVRQLVADIGFGSVQVSELRKKFGSRVIGYQYVRHPEIPLERSYTTTSANDLNSQPTRHLNQNIQATLRENQKDHQFLIDMWWKNP